VSSLIKGNNMQNIGFYATPESEEALQKYISLFSVEAEAAQLGHKYWRSIITQDWVYCQNLMKDNNIPASDATVMVTIAGMTWNLAATDWATRYREIWIQGEQLKEEADVIK